MPLKHRVMRTGIIGILWLTPLLALAAEECLDSSEAESKPIRAFTIASRWNALADLQYPVAVGAPYTADAVSKAINAVRQRLNKETRGELQTRGYVGVRYIDACPKKAEGDGVEVVINVIEVRLPLGDPFKGLLSIARSNLPSSLKGTPPAFRLLNPEIGLTQDRAMGVGQTVKLQSDLVSASGILHRRLSDRPSWTMPVIVEGSRGFDTNTYEGFVTVAVGREAPLRTLQRYEVNGSFQTSRLPQGGAVVFQNVARAGSTLRLRSSNGPIRKVTLIPAFRFASNRRISDVGIERIEEKAFQVVGVADAVTSFGPIRWAALMDAASPEERNSYRRFSTLFGWNGQIPLSARDSNQTLGVEFNVGAGRVWGRAPQYARYFAGNSNVDFLTEAADSHRLAWALAVPSLRSFGQSQAQTRFGGATSFWNVNLSIAIPIPCLSFPLIPRDEVIPGDESTNTAPVTLHEMVYRNGTRSSQSFLESYYENVEHKTPEAARRMAEADVRRIKPAMHFITRRANLYSVKPLFLMDTVHLSPGENLPGRAIQAVGGGVQLTLVVARFEAGYLRTLNPRAGDSSGNFVLRLKLENLF